ncbi:uncharacterized protein LOC116307610 [Actinia tenebrosa]|uniref:Uncharacterized protein LOC116307610 n=1 Tax=Actinia tenebrosa TaxID=6105 RepID=A0A6P8J2C6_ACTTE|nr:uncharacterized protein LOC116307610 [Actinia tenebrosa]
MAERRVVLAIDGSNYSDEAFNFYCENLHKENDLILVIHAFELNIIPTASYPYGLVYAEQWSDLSREANEESEEVLRKIGRKCEEHSKQNDKFKFELYKEDGKPGEVICKFAQDKKAEMIVIGCRGLGAIGRTLLGSVSDYCVHNAHIPVAVVRSSSPEEHKK